MIKKKLKERRKGTRAKETYGKAKGTHEKSKKTYDKETYVMGKGTYGGVKTSKREAVETVQGEGLSGYKAYSERLYERVWTTSVW